MWLRTLRRTRRFCAALSRPEATSTRAALMACSRWSALVAWRRCSVSRIATSMFLSWRRVASDRSR